MICTTSDATRPERATTDNVVLYNSGRTGHFRRELDLFGAAGMGCSESLHSGRSGSARFPAIGRAVGCRRAPNFHGVGCPERA